MKKSLTLLALALSTALFAGDPIPGIDITVNQSPGYTETLQTNDNGEVVFDDLKPGLCVLVLKYDGQRTVIGNRGNDRILIPANPNARTEPLRLALSDYPMAKAYVPEKKSAKAKESADIAEADATVDCKKIVEITPLPRKGVKVRVTCEG